MENALANPAPGTVFSLRYGHPVTRGIRKVDYPLGADCDHCGARLRVADGSADWVHNDSGRSGCELYPNIYPTQKGQ